MHSVVRKIVIRSYTISSELSNLNPQAKRALISLIIFLAVYFVFFPRPVGLETRPVFSESAVYSLPFNASFLLTVIAVPIIWKKQKAGSVAAILAALLFDAGVPLDYFGLVVPGKPPAPLLFSFEIVEVVVSLVLIALSYRTYIAKPSLSSLT